MGNLCQEEPDEEAALSFPFPISQVERAGDDPGAEDVSVPCLSWDGALWALVSQQSSGTRIWGEK